MGRKRLGHLSNSNCILVVYKIFYISETTGSKRSSTQPRKSLRRSKRVKNETADLNYYTDEESLYHTSAEFSDENEYTDDEHFFQRDQLQNRKKERVCRWRQQVTRQVVRCLKERLP